MRHCLLLGLDNAWCRAKLSIGPHRRIRGANNTWLFNYFIKKERERLVDRTVTGRCAIEINRNIVYE